MKRKRGQSFPLSDCAHNIITASPAYPAARASSLPPPATSSSDVASGAGDSDYDTPLPSIESLSSVSTTPSLLTEENLALLTQETMAEQGLGSTNPSMKTRTVTYSEPEYDIALNERGAYTDQELRERGTDMDYDPKPSNWDELEVALQGERSSPGLSDKNVKTLGEIIDSAFNESTITHGVIPRMIKLEDLLSSDGVSKGIPHGKWDEAGALPTCNPSIRIPSPYPDFTVGYQRSKLAARMNALRAVGSTACPITSHPYIAFPCFTLEAKGLDKAEGSRRQNRHNAAVMLRNMRHLRRKAGMSEETAQADFDGVARVLTVSISKYLAELECHWTQTNGKGTVEYYCRRVESWGLGSRKSIREVTRYVRNGIKWSLDENWGWICRDLDALEKALPPQEFQLPPTPRSKSSQESARKKQKTAHDDSLSIN